MKPLHGSPLLDPRGPQAGRRAASERRGQACVGRRRWPRLHRLHVCGESDSACSRAFLAKRTAVGAAGRMHAADAILHPHGAASREPPVRSKPRCGSRRPRSVRAAGSGPAPGRAHPSCGPRRSPSAGRPRIPRWFRKSATPWAQRSSFLASTWPCGSFRSPTHVIARVGAPTPATFSGHKVELGRTQIHWSQPFVWAEKKALRPGSRRDPR